MFLSANFKVVFTGFTRTITALTPRSKYKYRSCSKLCSRFFFRAIPTINFACSLFRF
jgi:hypothetical protein